MAAKVRSGVLFVPVESDRQVSALQRIPQVSNLTKTPNASNPSANPCRNNIPLNQLPVFQALSILRVKVYPRWPQHSVLASPQEANVLFTHSLASIDGRFTTDSLYIINVYFSKLKPTIETSDWITVISAAQQILQLLILGTQLCAKDTTHQTGYFCW